MKGAGFAEREGRNIGEKALAVFQGHLVRALHRPEWCLERAARGVFEAFALTQHRLVSDNARTTHLLHIPRSVGDHPMPVEKLHRFGTLIDDSDRVQKEPLPVDRVGVIG